MILMDKPDIITLGLAAKFLKKNGKNIENFSVCRDDSEELGTISKDVSEITMEVFRLHIAIISLSIRGSSIKWKRENFRRDRRP